MILKNRLLIALYDRRRTIFYLLVVCAVGAYCVLRFLPNEEKEVRKRLFLLEKGVAKSPGGNTMLALKRAQDVGNLFSDTCNFQTKYSYLSGVMNSRRITQILVQFHSEVSKAILHFDIKKIEFPKSGVARVLSIGKLGGDLTEGDPFVEIHGVVFQLEKIEGKWLITEVRIFDDPKDLSDVL